MQVNATSLLRKPQLYSTYDKNAVLAQKSLIERKLNDISPQNIPAVTGSDSFHMTVRMGIAHWTFGQF